MKNVNDHFYIQQVRAGNTKAFAGIVSAYSPMVLTLITKITGNREEAEDIAQEVFLKVYQHIDRFKEEAGFSTWLYKIAYNTTISELRKRKVFLISIDDHLNTVGEDEEIDEEGELRHQYLDEALKRLPADEAFLISLYYMEEQSVKEISRIADLSESNVKIKLHRIRKKLAAEINNLIRTQNG